ncbi:MAG: futalosine hydrolase [Desulfovibrionaceae bacterium]
MLLVATATEQEMRAALSLLRPPPPLSQGRVESVRLAGQECALLVTGVGLVNAAFSLGRALSLPGLKGVLNLGIAGSFSSVKFPLGSIVVARQEIWPEYGLGLENGVDAQALGFPLAVGETGPIWDRLNLEPEKAAEIMGLRLGKDWPGVDSLSVSTVSACQPRARELGEGYAAGIENMEGFALAYGCALQGLPFLEVRSISNMVGSREPGKWDIKTAFTALGRVLPELLG